MELTPTLERYILHWGEMGARWGVNRSVSQIHALLYLATKPMTAEEISETLSLARSNVSNSLKELQSWELIQLTHVLGDRRDHFAAKTDLWEMTKIIIEQRKRREIDPTMTMLRQTMIESEEDTDIDPGVKKRIKNMLEFMETLVNWYEQMSQLPNSTLIALIKMGGKIAKLIRRKE